MILVLFSISQRAFAIGRNQIFIKPKINGKRSNLLSVDDKQKLLAVAENEEEVFSCRNYNIWSLKDNVNKPFCGIGHLDYRNCLDLILHFI